MADPEERDSSSKGLSERLRELGYLQDPLTRFLSPSGAGHAGIVRTHLLVGSRVGVLVGFVVFVLLALGFLVVGRFIRVDASDTVLLLGYLLLICLPFGVLLGLLFAGVFALYALLRRRTHPRVTLAARKSAWTAALLILGYLLLLWVRMRERLTHIGALADLGAAAVCVAFSLLLGRIVYSAALYLGARRRSWDPQESAPRRSGFWSLIALVLLLVGAFAFLRLWAHAERGEVREASSFEVAEGGRLLWIGIDGLDLEFIEDLDAEGRLPTLQGLLAHGRLVRLSTDRPQHPLVFWTDISTGMPAERHGVQSPTLRQPRGLSGLLMVDRSMVGFFEVLNVFLPLIRLSKEEPLSAALLQEKPLHEILSDGDVASGVVNWWLTHPAGEGVKGVTITERATWLAWSRGREAAASASLREVNPAESLALFAPALRFPDDVREEPGAPGADELQYEADRRARALDETAVELGLALRDRPNLRALQVGLWGPNILDDALTSALTPSLSGSSQKVRRMGAFYEALDRRLARLIPSRQELERTRTLVCVTVAGQARRGEGGESIRDGGFCIFYGAGVRPAPASPTPRQVKPYDLLPTLLLYLGFPVSEEMPGSPLGDVIELDVSRPTIRSFGVRIFRSLPTPEENAEAMRMLRAFGYL